MKTREIEVFVNKKIIESNNWTSIISRIKEYPDGQPVYICGEEAIKAKLIIEVPEKVIQLTESEFDEAWDSMCKYGNYTHSKQELKQKLFKD